MSDAQFIYCEGCGARLTPQDRSCPKCGHPAPGILSTQSAASDLAAGKTASFPRLTQEQIENAIPVPTSADSAPANNPLDADATGVLDAGALAGVSSADRVRPRQAPAAGGYGADAAAYSVGASHDDQPPAKRARRGRWLAAAMALIVVAGGVWFVTSDPLGVMPGLYEQFDKAASEAFPSRQAPEDAPVEQDAEGGEGEEDSNSVADVADGTLSEDAAYTRLTAIYDRIVEFQDDLGPVIDGFNGYYMAKDRALREESAARAYGLRDTIQATIDELGSLKLMDGTAYTEDVEHLKQLATWMFNRVDVLCRSWDISLGLDDSAYPPDHQSEILAPLREVEMVNGKAIDVVEYERNVANWKPQQK